MAKEILKPYKNITTKNIFTEAGRCRPDQTVMLNGSQARKYKGLKGERSTKPVEVIDNDTDS